MFVSGCLRRWGAGDTACQWPLGTSSASAGILSGEAEGSSILGSPPLPLILRGHRKTGHPVMVAGEEGIGRVQDFVLFSGAGAVRVQ